MVSFMASALKRSPKRSKRVEKGQKTLESMNKNLQKPHVPSGNFG
jgi:hypothetical protein